MTRSPNIIHISWHDTGRHFACYGVPTVHTPNIDLLAQEGVLFENAFAAATLCSPSRGACLTGRYPQSNGLYYVCHANFGYRFHEGERHLSQMLRERGYYTALHGIQHEVHEANIREELPYFNEYLNIDPAPPIWPIPPCDVVAEGAVGFLAKRAAANQPFYLQLGFFETHRGYEFGGCVPDDSLGVHVPPYLKRTDAAVADHAALQGSIRKADDAVGKVLDQLRKSGLSNDTIVVFTPDHGLANPRAKATLYDPGMEIAFIMRWPEGGIEGGKRLRPLISNVDFVPTLFDLLGWNKEPAFQGLSFAGVFRDPELSPRDAVYAMHHCGQYFGEMRCVRTRTHKLIRNFSQLTQLTVPVDIEAGGFPMLQKPCGEILVPPIELYDLTTDPLETVNLAGNPELKDIQAGLESLLWKQMIDCADPILKGAITTPRHQDQLSAYRGWKLNNDQGVK